MKKKSGLYDYFAELMLYSGQYALFYIFMNLSEYGVNFFEDFGHVVLLLSLILQTVVAANLHKKPLLRALSTFIAPILYTAVEIGGDWEWILNLGHLFFWIYTFLLASLSYMYEKTRQKNIRVGAEFLITFINVSIFIFIYFYFDLRLAGEEAVLKGLVGASEQKDSLEIYEIGAGFSEFFKDPAHIFMVYGGVFLAFIIALGRVKIFSLNEKINHILAQYMDVKIRDRIVAGQGESSKKELVILFCDIRNFSKISEKNTSTDVVSALNLYYEEWSRVVTWHGGVINKFIGDAVLVIYGLDGDLKKAVRDSVDASLVMLGKLKHINAELYQKGLPQMEAIGIGIHQGEVIVGSIGGGERKDYTVIGDNVNIAQRIEQLSKKYDTPLLCSEDVYRLLGSDTETNFRYIGDEVLKGKSASTKIYGLKNTDRTRGPDGTIQHTDAG